MSFYWFFTVSLLLSPPSLGAFRIAIDPGHGGSEKGAVHGGVEESKIALEISQRLYERIKKDNDFDVQILRQIDKDLSLEDRVGLSQKFRPDLFVSIHANAHPKLPKVHGVEFYIQNQLPIDKETLFLAHNEFSEKSADNPQIMGDVESIVFDLQKSHRILKSYQASSFLRKSWKGKKRRMIRQAPFFVLSQNMSPAVLVEVGYLTHAQERKKLTQVSYQNQLVEKIYSALKSYKNNPSQLTAQ